MDSDPIIEAFFEEADELLSDYEEALLTLEGGSGGPDVLNRIFRSAHTLKGNSAMLGLEEIAHFTHALEDLLDGLRKGVREVTADTVSSLLASGDILKGMLERARDGQRPATREEQAETERVLASLKTLQGEVAVAHAVQAMAATPSAQDSVPREAPPPPADAPAEETLYEIAFRSRADAGEPRFDPAALFDSLAALARGLEVSTSSSEPLAAGAVTAQHCRDGIRIQAQSTAARQAIEEVLARAGAAEYSVCPISAMAVPAVSPALPPEAPEQPAELGDGGDAEGAAAEADLAAPAASGAAGRKPQSTSIRVPVEKVDRLINLVGELVITQSMVAQTVDSFSADQLPRMKDAVAQMDRHARELRERIMAVRMVPIKTLFTKFNRLVRDLVAVTGKKATLEVAGEDTELDKTVIEKIGDPLTHLIRNSLDHGIETPEERVAAGKPAAGAVRLEAYQQGGNICIEVSDDGRGLDRERIIAKAIQSGLVGPEQTLSDEQANALIFRPGFSTAQEVTEISGRGVGMDVVRRNVEALGGAISIRTERGKGTQFRITLPLTLAILDGQAVRVGGQTYILPLVSITESIQPLPGQLHAPAGIAEVILVRGQPVPIVRLHRLLAIANACDDPRRGLLVIVENEGRLAAILVDELLGQQQVVIKNLETNYRKVDGVAGATILGDGRVALILDIPGLLAIASGCALQAV
ncbi:MAG: chemotaxis protein CheA [Planctomycetes bacterium]|nr:chemotaxis protein CheA [Planctomycetota bacterium]